WEEIVELPRAQRIAVLLNSAGGELDALPIAGIATLEEIAQALAITPSEFDVLWSELGLPPNQVAEAQSLATAEQKFAFLWCHTPLEDRVISKMLGLTRQEVINRRAAARQRLDRRLEHIFRRR